MNNKRQKLDEKRFKSIEHDNQNEELEINENNAFNDEIIYIDRDNEDVYQYVNGVWERIYNLKNQNEIAYYHQNQKKKEDEKREIELNKLNELFNEYNRLNEVIKEREQTIEILKQQLIQSDRRFNEFNEIINSLKEDIENIKKNKHLFNASSSSRWDNTPSYIN